MDVNVEFPSRESAIIEAKKMNMYHPTKLYARGLEGQWVMIYGMENWQIIQI